MIKKYPLLPFLIFASFVAGTATIGLPVFASVGWFSSRKIYFWIHQSILIVSHLLVIRSEKFYVLIRDKGKEWELDH